MKQVIVVKGYHDQVIGVATEAHETLALIKKDYLNNGIPFPSETRQQDKIYRVKCTIINTNEYYSKI